MKRFLFIRKQIAPTAATCLFFCFASAYLNGQTLTPQSLQKETEALAEQRARAKEELDALEKFTEQYIRSGAEEQRAPCEYVVPVVLHVFHRLGESGVTAAQIQSAMNKLNQDFRAQNADFATVNPAFSGIKSGMDIRFELAKIDPRGNPTTGVVYYKDMEEGFGATWADDEIASVSWDNYKYLNVYLMRDLYSDNTGNNSGVAWYPDSWMSDKGIARIVYNWLYFGSGGSSVASDDFQSVFTHEAGHYLNLIHTFEGDNCNGTGDNVSDTPPTNTPGAGCNASPCGVLINGENYMDYNDCHKNFTKGQVDRIKAALEHATRKPLWQPENLIATGLLDPAAASPDCAPKLLSYSKTRLREADANTGTIEMPPVKIQLVGTQFAITGQALSAGTHYTLSNVPSGLTPKITVSAFGKSAELNFSGSASGHSAAASVGNMTLVFKDAAFSGGNAASVRNSTQVFKIQFNDPWTHTCDDNVSGVSITPNNTWKSWKTGGPVPRRFGLWYNSGKYMVETYGRAMVCEGTTRNISLLDDGAPIGPSSNWVIGNDDGNQHAVLSPSYTEWSGKTGFAGFRLQIGQDFYYGWMKLQVSANSVKLLAWHYNNRPNEYIAAGSACGASPPVGTFSPQEATLEFAIMPNPAGETFQLGQLPAGFGEGLLTISDQQGRIVRRETVRSDYHTSDVLDLPAGLYFVKLQERNSMKFGLRKLSVMH